ncbi:putative Aorsin [Glarea lozoyensis 74030]|uniref:tripeptidyl-peptidase II n=1 Tax=Glarea lozoyensis (strain ATCC 74030 / MF5533) TaxID=1104152 RepID=H0EJ42_GLAL7|nr:putative Aorsin [Glarea lozoyensis 74030]
MRIGLAQNNLDKGYEHLMDVSDPSSSNFGKHWTADDVINAFRPSDETEREVRNWLIDGGIPSSRISHSENKGWFAFYATVEEAEKLLYTTYHEYKDSVTGGVMPSSDEYHLPKNIRRHIDYITPGIKLLAPVESWQKKRDSKIPQARKDIEKRILHEVLQTSPNGHYNNSDLSTCKIPNGTHPVAANIDGGMQASDDLNYAGTECNLDLQLAYPIVYPQTLTDYEVDDYIVQSDQEDTYTFGFNTFLDALDGSYCTFAAYNETGNDPNLDQAYPDPRIGGWAGKLMCGTFKPTNVISLSYGGQESDLPISYQKRQCLEYMKLGLQGVSFLFASGDSGVSNYPGDIDGPTGCLGPNLDVFNPTWPGTCPFVTSVGATKVYPGKTVYDPESAVYDPAGHPYSVNFSSGGGFSNVYPIPKYQASAVSTFFEKHNPPYKSYSALAGDTSNITKKADIDALVGSSGGVYNRIGRGIPDIAAVGDNIAVYSGGRVRLSGGTSASAPIVSAVFNRINEERLNAGKSPIGFLNPSLGISDSMTRMSARTEPAESPTVMVSGNFNVNYIHKNSMLLV